MSDIAYFPYYQIFKNVKSTAIRAQYRMIQDELFNPDQDTGVFEHITLRVLTTRYDGGLVSFSEN